MEIERSVCGNQTGYRYELKLNAIQEPDLKTIEALIEAAEQLSQLHLCDVSIAFPEYLHPDAASKVASFVNAKPPNTRFWISADDHPLPEYVLNPGLKDQLSIDINIGKRTRSLKEDYLLKQRQIKELKAQIGRIHHSIPGFRANNYSYSRSPLPADTPVGDCTPQELWTALMLNSGFNQFDPYQVVSDLYANRELWLGFAMLPDIEVITAEEYPDLWRRGYLKFLSHLEYRHHCDTLYVLAAEDERVFKLVDFGKEWKADDVQVYTAQEAERILDRRGDALPVVRYWWD
ncbi:MAG TPA: hypothetical protein VK211_09375 [Kamptonema sp.]|nr:hypothetical protein [Kamptonema sp.]